MGHGEAQSGTAKSVQELYHSKRKSAELIESA